MEDNDTKTLSLIIKNLGPGTFGPVMELLRSFDNLYRIMGWDGLVMSGEDQIAVVEPESPYDVHVGTQFEAKSTRLEPSMMTSYVGNSRVRKPCTLLEEYAFGAVHG